MATEVVIPKLELPVKSKPKQKTPRLFQKNKIGSEIQRSMNITEYKVILNQSNNLRTKRGRTFSNPSNLRCRVCGEGIQWLDVIRTEKGNAVHKNCYTCGICGLHLEDQEAIDLETEFYCLTHNMSPDSPYHKSNAFAAIQQRKGKKKRS